MDDNLRQRDVVEMYTCKPNQYVPRKSNTSFYVMKERHGTGRENQTKHQQKLNNLKPKYRINHKNHKGDLKVLPCKKTQKEANIQKNKT